MELDELKNAWISLNNQLVKNEQINECMIKKMLQSKSNKALSKLLNFEFFGLIAGLLSIPILVWRIDDFWLKNIFFVKVIFMVLLIGSLIYIVWQCIKCYDLLKMDFLKDTKQNMIIVHKYNLRIQKEKIVYLFVGLIIGVLVVLCYYQLRVNYSLWIYLSVMLLVAAIATYWQYKRVYDKNINSIMNSLDELKELDDEK